MKKNILTIIIATGLLFNACNNPSTKQNQAQQAVPLQTDSTAAGDSSIVYKTDGLVIQKLSDHIYLHLSYLNTKDWGRVGCNGMLVVNESEAIVFDTPADSASSEELINYINSLKANIKAVIPTHFHGDCVGGLEAFNKHHIPFYASNRTIALLKNKHNPFAASFNAFDDSLGLDVGNKKVYAAYFGEGHTKDNIIGYFPEDNAVFGGCLIKETDAGKGNLEDANVSAWAGTVTKVKQQYPHARIVIPGHGTWGGIELFDYTIKLFQ